MKAFNFKTIIALLIFSSIISCSVDDYEIEGKSTKETMIQNEESALSTLAGIYDLIRPNSQVGLLPTIISLTLAGPEQQVVSNTQQSQEDLNSAYKAFFNNDVKPVPANRSRGGILTFYVQSYRAINLATFFINTIEKKGINEVSKTRQKQIIAEARALRAHAYFGVLRVFGQFYNPESEYGVITTKDVITNVTFLKRNKVSDTYDLMIEDLEYAIKNVRDINKRYYVTKEYAKGLLAKVYLYKGGVENWTKSARYCKEIIDNLGDKFALAPVGEYSTIFTDGIESKELIFSPYYNIKKGQGIGDNGQLPFSEENLKPSVSFSNLAKDDPRYKFTFGTPINTDLGTYNKYQSRQSAFQFLRVAEIYLIYAEAVARTNGDMQESLEALNKIRERAGVELRKFTTKAKLLEDIRIEKMLELHIENAQSWFDFVRYSKLGDINPTNIKPTVKNENQFIFPIPLRIIRNNKNFGPQNPGY